MAENDNVMDAQPVEPAPQQEGPSKGEKFKANAKEWLRKKTVALKRAPQNIPLVYLLIVSVYFLLVLFNVSQAVSAAADEDTTKATGICVFITTLLSILVLVSFLNAFPKRKKPNIFFIVLTFVMIAAMIACDVVYYVQMGNCYAGLRDQTSTMAKSIMACQPYMLVHVILLGLGAILFALLPVYSKLIQKINTKIVLESATENMHGEIDIQEE